MAVGGSTNAVSMDLSFRNVAGVVANLYAKDKAIQAAVRRLTRNAGELCKTLTQQACPVDTWFMHDHVHTTYSRKGMTFETGWREEDFTAAGLAFYPIYVEFGTRFMAPQPSLYPAYKEVQKMYLEDLRDVVQSAIARQGAGVGQGGARGRTGRRGGR
jgi:HK97 gp10 family phage protein